MDLTGRGARLLQFITLLTTILSFRTLSCEYYTSVDELARWSQETRKFIDKLDELVQSQETRLLEMRRARDLLKPIEHEVSRPRTLMDPVHIFVTLNRLRTAMIVVDHLESYDMETLSNDCDEFHGGDQFKVRIEEDLRGSGVALLRLQAFYGLSLSHLIGGNVVPNESSRTFRMNAEDCYQLGRIAYQDEQYGPAIVWLHAALELKVHANEALTGGGSEHEGNHLIDDILDHMAFAAYKLGLLEYSAKLTRTWLERDPNNERARENLDYYLDELSASELNESLSSRIFPMSSAGIGAVQERLLTLSTERYFQNYKNLSLEKYLVEDDEVVRWLCRQSEPTANTPNKCQTRTATFVRGYFYPGIRIETLNEDPKIVRIYDIITPKEAQHLQQQSRPRLQRSTIMLSSGERTSDFRIAKTAWVGGESDPIIERIENRLASILDIGLEQSELLQVVNYGLGGFYGPHLDSARASNASGDDSVLVNQLKRSDRYATILIYLNNVDAGGSTVFPLLNLTATPIERSAIVWLNILDNGFTDERTLHTGCPVSLGSKWVAVKWPREQANSFAGRNQWWRQRRR
uniref:procollagen-proline 4-dioxygenase n=1 Tax=Aceria tosichella TaxID=561515 RepID=A0A6G1S718_9ACAR